MPARVTADLRIADAHGGASRRPGCRLASADQQYPRQQRPTPIAAERPLGDCGTKGGLDEDVLGKVAVADQDGQLRSPQALRSSGVRSVEAVLAAVDVPCAPAIPLRPLPRAERPRVGTRLAVGQRPEAGYCSLPARQRS